MNEPMTHDDDQDWLNALAGKAPEGMDPVMRAQATAVRQAATTRREAIEADAQQHADGQALARLQARLGSEGLLQTPDEKPVTHSWLGKVLGLFGWGAGGGARVIPAWSVAAVLVLGVLVAYQVRGPHSEKNNVYRGSADVMTLTAKDPKKYAENLQNQLKSLQNDIKVTSREHMQVEIRIRNSPAVWDYLLMQNLVPASSGEYIIILIIPENKY